MSGSSRSRSSRSLRDLAGLLLLVALPACSQRSSPSSIAAGETRGASPKVGLGSVMVQVARRFEIAGQAAGANRFELAEFEAGELEELFEDDVPNAELPKEGPTAHIPAMAKAFLQGKIPDLKRAASSKDTAAFAAAFRSAAAVCNACHQAAAKGFIEVPAEMGKEVPVLDAVPASPAARPHP